MIFALLTSTQGHQLTLWWKFYLHSVMLTISIDLICHMTMSENINFWHLGHPQCPKVPSLGHDPGDRIKSLLICLYLSFVRTLTKFGITIFEIYMLPKFNDIWPLTSLQGHQFDLTTKIYLHYVLPVIPLDLTCHMSMFEKHKCLTTWTPPAPKVPPLGHATQATE